MLHQIQLNNSSQSKKIISAKPFHKIQFIKIVQNNLIDRDEPKGLRFTLKSDVFRYTCFSFQHPVLQRFNCFDVLDQFEIPKAKDRQFLEELTISCEGIEFDNETVIDILVDLN